MKVITRTIETTECNLTLIKLSEDFAPTVSATKVSYAGHKTREDVIANVMLEHDIDICKVDTINYVENKYSMTLDTFIKNSKIITKENN